MPPQDWGVVTSKGDKIYVHILKDPGEKSLLITGIDGKVKNASVMGKDQKVKFDQNKDGVKIDLDGIALSDKDTIVELEIKNKK